MNELEIRTLDFLGESGYDYGVTKDGQIWTRKTGRNRYPKGIWRKKSQIIDKDGYHHCSFWLVGHKYNKDCLVHRMVLEAFIGPCPKNMECRHLDGNSHNNNLENLCWGTHEEQSKDRERHGTTNAGKFINVGDKAPMAKLTEAKVKIIKQFLRAKNYKQWQIAEMFNISESAINMIHRKKTWWYVD